MRPIDADHVLAALNIFRDAEHGNRHFLSGIASAREIVENAPTIAPAPRWIPVEERLPETDGHYLVYRSNRPGCSWGVLYWYGGGWAANRSTAKSVTHWMPLPEPPER